MLYLLQSDLQTVRSLHLRRRRMSYAVDAVFPPDFLWAVCIPETRMKECFKLYESHLKGKKLFHLEILQLIKGIISQNTLKERKQNVVSCQSGSCPFASALVLPSALEWKRIHTMELHMPRFLQSVIIPHSLSIWAKCSLWSSVC